ncbi:dephospho-CoA kinase [Legionella geestiana]|uniref:Dephospho-CoA kinase n=1 Tax=Legionella geestiana TaxID=45065 RepID=A0A0W0TPB6_9GAMM|nr:dephospho-CoA kinase [Legionella geestiana]KTC97423.1 dephospho-CoA kinase [Legionella geestiana]QBS11270.1 dephospho-CoA kinase [Legionella geestiana]QDQ40965.1 dephospho-CoA kinase [Legionella geestiana]STX54100.1 dephospho-CoA kinase [Legionella geestiana]
MSLFCVGLTGNIGSGKSTVASMFAQLGISVSDADQAARALTLPRTPELRAITEHFGASVLREDGSLNRETLRARVFADAKERQWLEHLLHPAIRRMLEEDARNAPSPYCIVEIPLLYDKAPYPWISRVLLVVAGVQQQMERLNVQRRQSHDETRAILASQPDEAQRRLLADDVLENDTTLEALREKVLTLHHRYLDMAKNCGQSPDNA